MEQSALDLKLQQLERLLLRERSCIQTLVFDGLQELQEEKKCLLDELFEDASPCSAAQKQLAYTLREENLRNARQIWHALNLLRRTMDDCCRHLAPDGYNRHGTRRHLTPHGLLLKGRM